MATDLRRTRTSGDITEIIREIEDVLAEVDTNPEIRVSGNLSFPALGININYGEAAGNCGGGCFGCSGCSGCPGCKSEAAQTQQGGEVSNPAPTI